MLYDESLRPDVSFWLERFQAFREHPMEDLAHMAIYEIAVLSLRVKGDMNGQEEEIRAFVNYALESVDTDRMMDLACLVHYCTGAIFHSAVLFTAEEISTFRKRIVARVEELLDDAVDPNRKCALLDLRGFVAGCLDPTTREYPDVNAAVNYWLAMVELIPQAPLYDLGGFSYRLTATVEIYVDAERYDDLVMQIDELLARRTGRYSAAKARVGRAHKLIRAGRLLLGVRELNRAKHDWFSKETIGIAAAAVLDLSSHYSTLGLVYAAKYYALAAAWIVLQAGDDQAKRLVRPALIRAGECDYEAGAWLQALDFFSVAQLAEAAFSVELFTDADPDMDRLILYGGYILGLSKGQPAAVQEAVRQRIADWPDKAVLEHSADTARATFVEIASTPGGDAHRHLAMPPFVDAAPNRKFEWSALGVHWIISWTNTAEMTLVAEQFMAVLQLLTADLAPIDLYILPSRVEVQFGFTEDAGRRRLTRLPSNQASVWEMSVPNDFIEGNREQQHMMDVAQSIMLLQEVSLRPEEWPVLEGLAANGPLANTMVGELYTTLYRRLCALEPVILDAEYQDKSLTQIYLRREPHTELAWNKALIEEYDKSGVPAQLENRYKYFGASTKLTLPRLITSNATFKFLRKLRSEGWLDWQILGAVALVAMNYRVSRELGMQEPSPDTYRAFADKYVRKEEVESWPVVPTSVFTRQQLWMQMILNVVSTLKGAGLVCRQQTPNTEAMLMFVRHKMRYFDDDLPHDDIFATKV
ncbi:MAG: hypothetical protein MJE77_25750 [Proteobacteria bacterium]|nr:hypothetical protein [Pseudomonadota bacterium]